jgi:tRNA-specific 2-thiouridylase
MQEQGYECAGVTLELSGCSISKADKPDKTDAEDARKIAELLNMPYYLFNFEDDFKEEVIGRFVNAYINGATPNPCVDCNRFIKFKKIFERADELDYYYIATGHYAQVSESNGRYLLKKGADNKKDQSYVLYSLSQEQLARVRFPLGGLMKTEVRKIAEEQNFINAKKRESQDICFIPDGDYAGYIEKYSGRVFPDGDFTDISGNILGRHKGIIRYTNGQRRGLGLALKEPMYVFDKNIETNTVTLCTNQELYSKSLTARDINLIAVDNGKIGGKLKVKARARYNQIEQPATVEQTGADEIHVEFDNPQRALTKGQAVVLYDGDIVIGGGTII